MTSNYNYNVMIGSYNKMIVWKIIRLAWIGILNAHQESPELSVEFNLKSNIYTRYNFKSFQSFNLH